jgi:PiT family inorganic phosphate transporter
MSSAVPSFGAGPGSAVELELAVALTLAFAVTSGFHDAADAIATLVATRAASPAQAIVLASLFNVLGAVVFGTAVASAVASIVDVSGPAAIAVVGSAVTAALLWNVVTWWFGLPVSSGHALVGGLIGGALAVDGVDAVRWGGIESGHPVGVAGALIALAVAPVAGFLLGLLCGRLVRRALVRATARVSEPVRGAQWALAAALGFGHGSNDAQKLMGVVAVLLVAGGYQESFAVPVWVKFACGGALTVGTAFGGWRIVRTIGSGIFRLRPLDALASQAGASTILLTASAVGAPVSTTHVVTSAVVGAGGGRRRWRHVRWQVVESIGAGWLLTLPVTAALGAAAAVIWERLA